MCLLVTHFNPIILDVRFNSNRVLSYQVKLIGGSEKMKEFIEGCKTAKEAKQKASWAAKVVKVEGGYMVFEFMSDYTTWKNQK